MPDRGILVNQIKQGTAKVPTISLENNLATIEKPSISELIASKIRNSTIFSKDYLYVLAGGIRHLIDNSEKILPKEKKGIIDGLYNAKHLLKNAIDADNPNRIGIFGGMKRGKSTLINLLIGVDLLPVSVIQMSAAVVEIVCQKEHKNNLYSLEFTNLDGRVQHQENIDFNEAKRLVKEYGSHQNDSLADNIDKIRIISDFPNSKILRNNGILIDTPGAEKAFGKDNNELKNVSDIKNEKDTEKALKILDTVNLVLYLERADYLDNSNSSFFYKEYLNRYETLEIINWKDKIPIDDEEEKQKELQTTLAKKIGCFLNSPICISCKEWKNGLKNNDAELQKKSNIQLLENKILDKIGDNKFNNCLNRCLKEIELHLNQCSEEYGIEYVAKIFEDSQLEFYEFINFYSSLLNRLTFNYNAETFESARKIYDKYHSNGVSC